MSKIRAVAGDSLVILSPSGSIVERSDILYTASGSSYAHGTGSTMVRAINKICSQVMTILYIYQGNGSLHVR